MKPEKRESPAKNQTSGYEKPCNDFKRFGRGKISFAAGFNGQYQTPTQERLFQELELLLENLELDKTIFRSDHASNYLVLKGVLGKDKPDLLAQVRAAIHTPDRIHLREEWQRGL
ncbi:MAG: hypothetical protein MI867_01710 [Pseudomonadales bacterium]|nr:hypothetical protein [Pseudomonadales bacterium]